jgi:archaemetzincin
MLSVPVRAFSHERGQHHSTELLNVLATQGHGEKRIRLGITTADLFVPELNFVFGEASSSQRVAVFSLARLDPRAYGDRQNSGKLTRRAVIEALHELGHVFGLGHCTRPDCVMWFSNTLSETDRKGSNFCQRCAAQLGVGSLIPQ